MIKTKIVSQISFPKIVLQKDLEHIAKNIIIPDIIRGIDTGMAISGGQLPYNEPETIKYKFRHGLGNKSLIATGELRSSFIYRRSGENRIVISLADGRKKIGAHLQNGINTRRGMKQYRFFGISPDAFDQIRLYLKEVIREITKRKK